MRINHQLQPMLDYHKAKDLFWDPRKIDLSQDIKDWQRLDDREQDFTLRLCALFHSGEEAVAHDLTPLLIALRREGRHLEEELFLATQLFEEAKHLEWFDRWYDEVVSTKIDLEAYHTPSYRQIFYQELPNALSRPLADSSKEAQADACATYHMIVEGVLAETGYFSFAQALKKRGLMPGLSEGMKNIQVDEARHIAFGVYLLQRLVKEDRKIWDVILERMNRLLPLAIGVISESFDVYGDRVPFGLSLAQLSDYAGRQFNNRLQAIMRAL